MPNLDRDDHALLVKFLGAILDRYRGDEVDREDAIGDIAHLVAAFYRPNGEDHRAYMRSIIVGEPSGLLD